MDWESASDHALASVGDTLRRSTVRRQHGKRGGGFSGDGTTKLGGDDERPTEELETSAMGKR